MGRPRGRSPQAREGRGRGGGRGEGGGREGELAAAAERRQAVPAPVTPVDPLLAQAAAREEDALREGIARRMEQVSMEVDTNNAVERVEAIVQANEAIKAQERMQLLQEVEFAAVCSRRASAAGLQTERQKEEVRRLWVAEMSRVGQGQLAEAAFATYGPTGVPPEEQDMALRKAIRVANLGVEAAEGYGREAEGIAEVDGPRDLQSRPMSQGGGEGRGRSRSKSVRSRGGARARKE